MVEFNVSKTASVNFSLKSQKSNLNLQLNENAVKQLADHKHVGICFVTKPKQEKTYRA